MTERVSVEHLVKKVEPEYPPEAKATRLEGDVFFWIIIGKNGKVKEIHLRRGKPILIEAAAKALSEWQYEAFMLNGEAVESRKPCNHPVSTTPQTSVKPHR